MDRHRAGSLVALAAGVALMFVGLSSALGFSITGMVASTAAIAALLYAGGVWLGGSAQPDRQVLLFTPGLMVATGPASGQPIGELFPDSTRAAVEEHCRLALEGRTTRFKTADGGVITASPVRCPEGAVVYGLLLSGQAAEAAASELTSV